MRQFELPVKLLGAKQVGFLTTESQTEYVVLSLIIVIVPHKKWDLLFRCEIKIKHQTIMIRILFVQKAWSPRLFYRKYFHVVSEENANQAPQKRKVQVKK